MPPNRGTLAQVAINPHGIFGAETVGTAISEMVTTTWKIDSIPENIFPHKKTWAGIWSAFFRGIDPDTSRSGSGSTFIHRILVNFQEWCRAPRIDRLSLRSLDLQSFPRPSFLSGGNTCRVCSWCGKMACLGSKTKSLVSRSISITYLHLIRELTGSAKHTDAQTHTQTNSSITNVNGLCCDLLREKKKKMRHRDNRHGLMARINIAKFLVSQNLVRRVAENECGSNVLVLV